MLVYDRRVGAFGFSGLEGRIKKVRCLEDGSELKLVTPWNGEDHPRAAFVELGNATLYDERDTVLELELQN